MTDLQTAAQEGNADAQWLLGWMYDEGDSVEQNFELAAFWWHKAAELGDMRAKRILGVRHLFGLYGVPQDFDIAARYLTSAAGQDHMAKFMLGLLYEYGHGVPQHRALALELYREAQTNGFSEAMAALEEADGYGSELAHNCLARAYRMSSGCGPVKRESARDFEWWTEAAYSQKPIFSYFLAFSAQAYRWWLEDADKEGAARPVKNHL